MTRPEQVVESEGPFGADIVTAVQPYQAVRRYLCPGCEAGIDPGVGHVVVVPELAPDLRRHWHRGCWYREVRSRRRGTE